MDTANFDLAQFAKVALLGAATFKDQTAQISPSLWERVEPLFGEIVDEFGAYWQGTSLPTQIEALSADPYNARLRVYLEEQISIPLSKENDLRQRLAAILLHLSEFGRLLPHHGPLADELQEARSLDAQIDLLKNIPARLSPSIAPEILVVLPFRCSNDDRARLRNLLSCIMALSRQSIERDKFYVIAVEQDGEPVLRDLISPLVDKYVFAENRGQFSIAWGRNVGVREGPSCEFVCLLDTDLSVGPDFLEGCLANLSTEIGGILPFHRVLCLDSRSSSFVVDKLVTSGSLPVPRYLRGHVMNEVYGFAIATTSKVYNQIGGQDERYRDWGDEDNEFYSQLRSVTEVRRLPTLVYHLDHKRPVMRKNGSRNNAHAIANPRKLGGSFGFLDRYRT